MYVVVLLIGAVILGLSIIFVLIPAANSSEKAYIGYQPSRFILVKDHPTICIHEPEDAYVISQGYNMTEIAQNAIKSWVDGLKNRTVNDDRWDFQIITTSSTENKGKPYEHFTDRCDIQINFVSLINNGVTTAGNTNSRFIPLVGKVYNFIEVTTTTVINEDIVDRKPAQIEYITKHELGHVFGLDHLNDPWDDNKKSVMYPKTNIYEVQIELQDVDYAAVINYHTNDGWGGMINQNATDKFYLP